MKSFGKYISKHLASFSLLVILLLFIDVLSFLLAFHNIITTDYGPTSPKIMLEKAANASAEKGISEEMKQALEQNHIWAMFLNSEGKSMWSVDLPENVPESYTLQDVAVFSKGYIENYPVFIRNTDDGLLILGYPQNSYTKLTSNYYSFKTIKMVPIFFIIMVAFDLLFLFMVYFLSKKKIIENTEPIIASIETLSDGRPVSLSISGELFEVAESVNKASRIISSQNQARASWISGVSHDIRTPLSMIMGYARRITCDSEATTCIKDQAEIIRMQSIKIKELVQDLNLVSQLEYEMQPLNKKVIRISKLLRSYVAELLNTGIPNTHSIDIEIMPGAEIITLEGDERLLSRAINNLVQNSIHHNPQGCEVTLLLDCSENTFSIIVKDNGIGLSPEKLQELENKPHYMESVDDRLDLRHGLGLLLVRQIVDVHGGTMQLESKPQKGYQTKLIFPIKNNFKASK